ncbi:MAG: hypothetical protein KIT11_11315 [Fimbriimonadaceae bacterium]|nr:hypothetical protein [Fimbriimonadaceae bacterium]QYK55379.1 MAG: hypothetical protein KF733_10220 [Fimbriimonadaceae bacterium]
MIPLLAALALAPHAAPWRVNSFHTLVWDETPYLPVGVHVPAQPEAVQAAVDAGIHDLVVEIGGDASDWPKAAEVLEKNGCRYALKLSVARPTADTVIVEPQGYRIPDILRPRDIELRLPGASEALLILVKAREGSVRWFRRVPVIDGVLSDHIDPEVELPHVLLVYPTQRDLRAPDYWSAFDEHRDYLLEIFRSRPPGPGCRAIIDPGGAGVAQTEGAVPLSPLFHTELADYLKSRYKDVASALRAWSIAANDIDSFTVMARLVPLWSETRGIAQFFDPRENRLYTTDQQRSTAWADIRQVKRLAGARRLDRLKATLRKIADLPVIQTWHEWADEAVLSEGLAFSTETGSVPAMVEGASRPLSSVLRRRDPSSLWATDLTLVDGGLSAEDVVRELEGMGVRGWFFRAGDRGTLQAVASIAAARASDLSSAEWTVRPLFYPEAARGAAAPVRLRGGLWWLPTPTPGDRIDYGAGYEGYRGSDALGPFFAIWSREGARPTKLRLTDEKGVTATDLDGNITELRVRRHRTELLVPDLPVILRGLTVPPVPEQAMAETTSALATLFDHFENRVDPAGSEKYLFSGKLRDFEQEPGGSYKTLREQLNRLVPRAAPYTWIEAFRCPKHDFSEVRQTAGSASESTLALASRIRPSGDSFVGTWPIPRRASGKQEVWVAASVAGNDLSALTVTLGTAVLKPEAAPVSFYGAGFGWYKLGECDLSTQVETIQVRVEPRLGLDLELDVIVVGPPGFRPDGPRPPITFLSPSPTEGKGSGGL